MARPGQWVLAAAVFTAVGGATFTPSAAVPSRPTVTVYKTPT